MILQVGNSIDFKTCLHLKVYCEAFFYGYTVKIELLDDGIKFLEQRDIPYRTNNGQKQYNAANINQELT